MTDGLHLTCATFGCDSTKFVCYDGYYYCQLCEVQAAEGTMHSVVDNGDTHVTQETVRIYAKRRVVPDVKTKQLPQSQPPSQFWQTLQTQEDNAEATGDHGPAECPVESGTSCHEDYYSEIRMRYVMGVQIMLQLQIKALVDKFNVSPVILDLVEPIWSKFVASTEVFTDGRAKEVVEESRSKVINRRTDHISGKTKDEAEPRRCMIWYRYVSKTIPLWYSLVISFLVCHLAREPILSTDIIQWTIEGKLPYFAAFLEIDKQIGTGPISSRYMFRPIHAITVQKMESLAASVANSIRLELPPVNFYAIASRYLRQLSFPVETILPHACRIYEWSMPSELWLSANEFRLPTRSFVLSILIVAIRILYNIHGFGKWEMSLSSSHHEAESDILHVLHSKYNKLTETSDHGKDLEKYLKYCKDVVFAEVQLSFEEQDQEDKLMEDIWDFYQKKQKKANKRPRDSSKIEANNSKKPKTGSHKEREIQRMILNMEENRFCYIPPRSRVKRLDYLHYTRKKGDGIYVYAAHADYYILLRSCARVARLDVRTMHAAVLTFERQLDWLEKNIHHCLKHAPSYKACELCHDDVIIQNDG